MSDSITPAKIMQVKFYCRHCKLFAKHVVFVSTHWICGACGKEVEPEAAFDKRLCREERFHGGFAYIADPDKAIPKPKRVRACIACGRTRSIHAHDMCGACYKKQRVAA